MSKELHIIRHGKSSWDYENISDIDRPLNIRGINDSYFMAKRLLEKGIKPDQMITSPATRAIHSAVIYMRTFKLPCDRLVINEHVYMGYVEDVLEIIREIDDSYNCILMFGHNPTFTSLANHFLTNPTDNIPTAGIVGFTFNTSSWGKVIKSTPVKEYFDYPKKE